MSTQQTFEEKLATPEAPNKDRGIFGRLAVLNEKGKAAVLMSGPKTSFEGRQEFETWAFVSLVLTKIKALFFFTAILS